MTDPMAALRELSYLFRDPPEPGHAMGRLEVVTPGGTTALSMPDIGIEYRDGRVIATFDMPRMDGEADSHSPPSRCSPIGLGTAPKSPQAEDIDQGVQP